MEPSKEAISEAYAIEMAIACEKHDQTFISWLAPRIDAFAARAVAEERERREASERKLSRLMERIEVVIGKGVPLAVERELDAALKEAREP